MYIGKANQLKQMCYVYILQSEKNGSYYVGSSCDITKRLAEHNSGHTKSLKYIRPVKMVFSKKYDSVKTARAIELKIKKSKSRKIIEKIIIDQKINMGL